MNRRHACAACLLVWLGVRTALAGSLFTNAVIYVAPTTLDFGPVAGGTTATNTFLVENVGGGKLVGTVTVPAPFKILSGGGYTLRAKEAQVITITYTPSGAATDTGTAKFTGGSGVNATVTGRLAVAAPKKSRRK